MMTLSRDSLPPAILLLLGVFIPVLSYAQVDVNAGDALQDHLLDLSLEDLVRIKVSVSSLQEESIFETASTVTVIDRKTIEQYHYTSVAEALDTVAGFEVYQTIIDRNVPTSRGVLQNFYANKVLLLIDNVPTWQPIYGEGSLDRISIQDVEKIEVLKGPASVLYGSNAYTGVVNVVLSKGGAGTSGYVRVGSDDLRAAGVRLQHQLDELSLFLSVNTESQESDSYQVTSAEGHEFNGELNFDYENYSEKNNINVGGSYQGHSVYLNYYSFDHSYLGIHPSYIGGGGKIVENEGTLLNYTFESAVSDNSNLMASLSYDDFERYFPVSYDFSSAHILKATRYVSELKFDYQQASINIESGLGAELRQSDGHENINSQTGELIQHNLKDDDDVWEWSSFARIGYKLNDFNFLVGGRYTDNENFGNNFSSHLSGVYAIDSRQSIKMIVAESFRVPTMFELYFERPIVKGNADLEPETSTSYELAYLYGGDQLFVQALAYYGVYENLIQRQVPEAGPPAKYQNVNDFEGYGTELELRYEFSPTLSSYVNYNYVQGAGEGSEANYQFVPDHTVSYGVNKEFSHFSLSVKGKYISEVDGYIDEISSQSILSINVSKRQRVQGLALRHVLSIDNVTDSEMLTPEYIRETDNVNSIATADFGTRYSYSMYVDF